MRKTLFAGLTQLDPLDPLSTDGYSFQNENPEIIDRLLELGAVTHRHDNHPALADPVPPPSCASGVAVGQIPGGVTFEFAYTLIDGDRGETLPSPICSVTTPDILGAPTSAPVGSADYAAGSLAADAYYYGATWVDAGGGETTLGAIEPVDVDPFPNARVLLSGLTTDMPDGAIAWRLYRARGGEGFHYVASGATDTLIDDGSLCANCQVFPPVVNTTTQNSSLQVTVPALPSSAAVSWRLYGRSAGADWPLDSYVASGTAGATVTLTTFAPTHGRPPSRSLALRGAHQIDPDTELLDWHWKRPVASAGALPTVGNASGDVRATLDSGILHIWLNGAWEDTGGGGGGSTRPMIGQFNIASGGMIPADEGAGFTDFNIVVGSGGAIEDVELSIWLDGNYDVANPQDIGLSLLSPTGTEILLWDGQGASPLGSGALIASRAIFTDEGDRDIGASFIGSSHVGRFLPTYHREDVGVSPAYRMGDFVGENPTGTWKVRCVNYGETEPQFLQRASLHFKTRRLRDSLSFSVQGAVATGSGNAMTPQFVAANPLGWNRAGRGEPLMVNVRHKLAAGSATISVQLNGSDINTFANMPVTVAADMAPTRHPSWAPIKGPGVFDPPSSARIDVAIVAASPDARGLTVSVEIERDPPI